MRRASPFWPRVAIARGWCSPRDAAADVQFHLPCQVGDRKVISSESGMSLLIRLAMALRQTSYPGLDLLDDRLTQMSRDGFY